MILVSNLKKRADILAIARTSKRSRLDSKNARKESTLVAELWAGIARTAAFALFDSAKQNGRRCGGVSPTRSD